MQGDEVKERDAARVLSLVDDAAPVAEHGKRVGNFLVVKAHVLHRIAAALEGSGETCLRAHGVEVVVRKRRCGRGTGAA